MKTPITTEPITMKTRHSASDMYTARAWSPVLQRKLSATSTSGHAGAALNLAVRHFFGGCLIAHGVGLEERAAIFLQQVPNGFRAELKNPHVLSSKQRKAVAA